MRNKRRLQKSIRYYRNDDSALDYNIIQQMDEQKKTMLENDSGSEGESDNESDKKLKRLKNIERIHNNNYINSFNNFIKNDKDIISSFKEMNLNSDQLNKEMEPLEILFWRIFRNVYLNKKVFSFLISKKNHTYDVNFCVPIIYRDFPNASEIIMDKVKSGSYLSFGNESLDQQHGFGLIFRHIQEDNEYNRNFYQKLFENYSNYFSSKELSTKIIEAHNILAFNVLNPVEIDPVYIPPITNYQSFKMINHLLKKGHYANFRFHDFNPFADSIKLKHILKMVKKISLSQRSIDQNTINEITNPNNFTKDQLSSTINQLLDTQSSLINNRPSNRHMDAIKILILKNLNILLKDLQSVDTKIPLDYYLLFEEKEVIFNKLSELFFLNYIDYNIVIKSMCSFLKFGKFNNIDPSIFSNHFNIVLNKFKNGCLMKTIFKTIFETNNINFIDVLLQPNSTLLAHYAPQIIQSIKSTQILDYFFEKHQNLLFSPGNSYWFYVTETPIIEHYEKLMTSLKRTFSMVTRDCNPFGYDSLDFKNSLDLLLRAMNKPELYSFPTQIDITPLVNVFSYYLEKSKQDTIISLIRSNRFGTRFSLDKITKIYRTVSKAYPKLNRIGYWILENLIELKPDKNYLYTTERFYNLQVYTDNGTVEIFLSTKDLLSIYIQTGNYNEIFKMDVLKFDQLINAIPSFQVNVELIDLVLKAYMQTIPGDSFFVSTFKDNFSKLIFEYGNAPLLLHLVSKYKDTIFYNLGFKKNDFDIFLERALKLQNFDLVEIILKSFERTIDKYDLKRIVSKDSNIYKKLIDRF
ncbi:hypothetical protein DICPUDRAFT_76920 [Dictyostelium purpureum]|uniref:Uncharacterized protein n=1 Tax=Dictyostelium purpureum TaxID=5786 RepID=F0ZF21_DICPU|nr:uncharacterized protein DICPUDRAFT_76920 [Dictyostelium purpureum]EGC37458.1 hypothetical protein DICPUDRAFT_76920 [Dictyostelium purpureum]|eukprot:XP_003286022.1 hypothetical protein DICPUDRAFT_76920 [Dictyostelium purpureum]